MLNKLLKIFGYTLTFITGDTLAADRLIWMKRNLPKTRNDEKLLDVGCGSGAMSFAACKRGYEVTGMSWDRRNQKKAEVRAKNLNMADKTKFPIGDARELEKLFPKESFDIVLNFENIEHILHDNKLMKDIYGVLKPGGYLYLTTPNSYYWPMSKGDLGPFTSIEDGSHVRRGYTPAMLLELSEMTGFKIEKIEYCSFIGSQLTTRLMRYIENKFTWLTGWLLILPLRPIAFLLEKYIRIGRGYSITMIAMKPRFGHNK